MAAIVSPSYMTQACPPWFGFQTRKSLVSDVTCTELGSYNGSRCRLVRRKQMPRDPLFVVCQAASSGSVLEKLPVNYRQLIGQVQTATQAALSDGHKLLEIEFPTAGLDSVPGDAEGGIEMTESMGYVSEFCALFSRTDRGPFTRIFLPDVNEVSKAQKGIFEDTIFQLDYLTKPSGLEDFGFSQKVKMSERVRPTDEVFVAAYPYFNVNEMLAVEQLYREAAQPSNRPLIVFNGELDRIRSGYYPAFFYPKLGKLAKNFLPEMEASYYLHNFKGNRGGKLFRVYPGPWQVLQGNSVDGLQCIHTQETMPTLKEVALNILGRM